MVEVSATTFVRVRVTSIDAESTELTETRGYDSPLRREQARETQRRIVDAARGLLLEQGYAATTMAAVASAAGVSTQTVYKAFGTKAALIKKVYDVTLAGDDEPISMADRPEVRAAYAEPDPEVFLRLYADLGRTLMERLAPLYRVIVAGAAAGDTDLQALAETTRKERLFGTTMVARRVQELGALRPGVSLEQARDSVWTLNDPSVWESLVTYRGWTPAEYSDWVGRAMAAAVLDPARLS